MTLYAQTIDGNYAVDAVNPVPFCYLHGVLEKENGFDCFGANAEDYRAINSTNHAIFPNIEVIFADGRKFSAEFFFWHNGDQCRGLVVDKGDIKGLEYARNCYEGRFLFL